MAAKAHIVIVLLAFAIFSTNLFSASTSTPLNLEPSSANQIKHSLIDTQTEMIVTAGTDPYIRTKPLYATLPQNHIVLSFDYFCPSGINDFQLFYCPPETESKSANLPDIDMAEGWTTYSIDLSDKIPNWGNPGDYLRLDFGRKPNINIQIRNLQLRTYTDQEKQIAQQREVKKQRDAQLHSNIEKYLNTNFTNHIDKVTVDSDTITISGTSKQTTDTFLCEIPPYLDVNDNLIISNQIHQNLFTVSLPRYTIYNNIKYDRLLSKWAIMLKSNSSANLISYAHYPDKIEPLYNLPLEKPTGRKGIGGFDISRGHTSDLDDLNITSVTVNILFTGFMFTQPSPDRIEHSYNGTNFYFDKHQINRLDQTLQETAKRNIIVAAILLVGKAQHCPDQEIGKLLQHPDMDPTGIFSMPNMTSPQSVNCYAAALDFLASRYNRPDKQFGRIHHWIMHNEVDAGWTWTNMGTKTDLVFMNEYIKSMRMCYAIARSYNPHSEVFISLTHYWAWTSHPRYYPSKDLIDILLKFSKAEGDFQWAVAHHPYPESLFEPKTWLDKKAEFNINTPLITFKNIEVLDQWIKSPQMLYKGSQKRTLWLSENGTNSKTYSEKDLAEQAAGFAYTWKSMKDLDGIDGFQWHNWIDNRGEGGLRIGLRKFPDQPDDPAGRKPVWFLYQAADTNNEEKLFDPYLKIIGIENWSEISKFEK